MSANAFVAGAYGILGAFFFVAGLAQLISGLASRSWDTVSGEIIESRVRYPWMGFRSGFRSRFRWLAEIRYRYTIEGLTYEGDRFGFGKLLWFASRGAAERAVAMYPTGRIVRLLVSPSDRSEAVVEPGIGWRAVIMTLTGALVAALSVYSILP